MPAAPTLRSSAPWRALDGFGGAQRATSRSVRPRSVDELAAAFRRAREEGFSVVLRGAGRSYGDASLNAGGLAVDATGLDRILGWDPEAGVADVEAGVTIEALWRRTIADGWWPAVVPGTMFPTIGGCVSMNIHGKNCFRVGPFGDHVRDLDLLTAGGELRTLSREQDGELFHATIAGLGLLGAVTRARLQLKKVESGRMLVRPYRSRTFGEMFDQFEQQLPHSDYLVGWVDCFATGGALGRGLVHRANHLRASEDSEAAASLAVERQGLPGSVFGVPRSLIWMFLKPFTQDSGMRLVNALKYRAPEAPFAPDGAYRQSHVAFAFLLDYIPNWRLAYGDGGFIQYQAFLPNTTARQVMPELLRVCQQRGIVSYLGVFKRHRPDPFLLSHGLDGWSLALDFPARPGEWQRLTALARELTARVLDAGGTFYPAKDSVLNAEEFARAYGDRLTRFVDIKRRMDPDGLFLGDQARRLMPMLARS